jgi:hypothetical protein
MKISIIVPYPDAEQQFRFWAMEEKTIDFRRDAERATRCTLSFAAMELSYFLSRTLEDVAITVTSQPVAGFLNIRLQVIDFASRHEGFRFDPESHGLVITGQGRTGVLYGVYELLRLQGWRWYAPGEEGQVTPLLQHELTLPEEKKEFTPSLHFGRGFDFDGVSKESAKLLIWMARNRMNVCCYRPNTSALANKLGMQFKTGGHIFEEILNPDRVMPSGKTLWQEHEEWFGLPQSGLREKSKALATQFCVSQPDLHLFLAEELLSRLMGEFSTVDRLDVWGFDTWGGICTCPECRALGNGTDQILFLVSYFRDFLNRSHAEGRLDRPVQLVICAYEGTSTLKGPEHPVPTNLATSGDYAVFYPINRCYAHDIDDVGCSVNVGYDQALRSWLSPKPGIPVTIGEYYNVSKFEDLPLLFNARIKNDLPHYTELGVSGITYMHVPLFNWAIRTLTQNLYAQLAWNIETDVSQFIDEYFEKWYGPYADDLRSIYEKIEEAWLLAADWRAWSGRSILTQLQRWDGKRPEIPLAMDNHFETSARAIQSGRRSIALLQEAMAMLNGVQKKDQQLLFPVSDSSAVAVNPIQARLLESAGSYERRLGEDRRILRYGLDTMSLMTKMVAYHDALYRQDDDEAGMVWEQVEQIADALDSYYIPIEFESFEAGFVSKDALTRTQLRDVIRRCRQFRNKNVSGSKTL